MSNDKVAQKKAERKKARAEKIRAEKAAQTQQAQERAAKRNAAEKAEALRAKKQPEIKSPKREAAVIELTPDMMLGATENKRPGILKSLWKNAPVIGIGMVAGFCSRTIIKSIVMQFGVAAALTTVPAVATASALIPFVIGGMIFGAVGGMASTFARDFVKAARTHRQKAEQKPTWREAFAMAWRDRSKRRAVIGKDGKVKEKRGWLAESMINGALLGALGGAFGGVFAETLSHWGSLSNLVGEHVSEKIGSRMAALGKAVSWAKSALTVRTEAMASTIHQNATSVGQTIAASIRQTTAHINMTMQSEFEAISTSTRPNIRQTILAAISGVPSLDKLTRFLPKGLFVPKLDLTAATPSAPISPCATAHTAALKEALETPRGIIGAHTVKEAAEKDFFALTGSNRPGLKQVIADSVANGPKPTPTYALPKDLAETKLSLAHVPTDHTVAAVTETPKASMADAVHPFVSVKMPDTFNGLMNQKVFDMIPEQARLKLVSELKGAPSVEKDLRAMTDAAYYLLNKSFGSSLSKVPGSARKAAFFLYREAATTAVETGQTNSKLGKLANANLSYCLRNGIGSARDVTKATFHALLGEGTMTADQTLQAINQTDPQLVASIRSEMPKIMERLQPQMQAAL